MTRPYVSHEERRAHVLGMVTDAGVTGDQIRIALGFKHRGNVNAITAELLKEGLIFGFLARTGADPADRGRQTIYFKTRTARDLAESARKDYVAARRKQHKRIYSAEHRERDNAARRAKRRAILAANKDAKARQQAEARARRAAEAEIAKQQARRVREAQAAEKARQKVEAKKLKARLQAETKAAGQLAKLKAAKPAPVTAKKTAGPAHIPGPIVIPPTAKITVAPSMPSRWGNDAPPCFSSLKPGQYLDAQPKSWVEAVAA